MLIWVINDANMKSMNIMNSVGIFNDSVAMNNNSSG